MASIEDTLGMPMPVLYVLETGTSIGLFPTPGSRGRGRPVEPGVAVVVRNPALVLERPRRKRDTGSSVARLTPAEAREAARELDRAADRAEGWYVTDPG